ncbi:MAG: DUF302 domain-containing protein [Gammaproteobacteria bacterium]|nr:DUF302 domain-containing protein [Gammaproteobacteria bacterium]
MKLFFTAILASMLLFGTVQASDKADSGEPFNKAMAKQFIGMSIQKFKIDEDVSIDEAIESMKLRANMLNFKMVADLPLSEQVKAMGKKARRMQILAFCDAVIAQQMVEFDIIFAGFLPCRIAAVEDAEGNGWLISTNMDMMLHAVDLPDHIRPLAQTVRDNIYSIIDAGVSGDL